MAWTNAFGIGACELRAYSAEGVLIPEEEWGSAGISSVSESNGVVTVEASSAFSLKFVVVPSYDTNSMPVRVQDMSAAFSDETVVQMADAIVGESVGDPSGSEALTPDGEGGYTPDPATFSEAGVWTLAGVQMEAGV